GAVRGTGRRGKVHVNLVAAYGIEDVLCAARQADGGEVPLVVPGIAVTAGRHVQVVGSVARRGHAQSRRLLFGRWFARHQLGPASAGDLRAAAQGVFVHIAVQAVTVDEPAVGINRRRAVRVARLGEVRVFPEWG